MTSSPHESEVSVHGLDGPGLLREPDRRVIGGLIALHGAEQPKRRQPLFEHLASVLVPLGIAVLSYDRRPAPEREDLPLDVQAADAAKAADWMRERYGAPVALFGFSQGAWAACVTAARVPIAALALVGCSGVSPARQMRFHTDQLLLRAGFDVGARAQLRELRLAMEDLLRGVGDRVGTDAMLRAAVQQPWFPMSYLPPELPPQGARWDDMDFEPGSVIERIAAPTLLVFGSDEDTVPISESIDTWRAHGDGPLTVVELPGCGHAPTASGRAPLDLADISPEYTRALRAFVANAFTTTAPGRTGGSLE